jgi:Zn-dependent peptidase ImmA (M78 family)/DNA-binding XRE family transcriptional regulator
MHTPDDIKQGFGQRLRLFRERAGFSLADLAVKLGGSLSRQAISKYENGQSFPNSTHLLKLCDALHVNPDDLLDASPRPLEAVEFRRLARFGAADQRKLRGTLELEFERMHQLNDCLGLKPSFHQPLKGSGKISKPEKAEDAALQLRQKWELGLDAITSMIALLESKGIHVHLESTTKPFYGVSGWSGGIPVVVLNQHAAATDPARLRFTAAHELGHLVMPIQEGLTSKEQEKLCNRFAGAFLMPAETLRRELGPGKRMKLMPYELIALKAAYGLSLSALYQRAAQTGIINERQLKSWNITCRKAGWHKNEPGEYHGQESPRLFRQHLLHALAEERITESKAATLAHRTISEIRQMMTTGRDRD